MTTTNEVGEPKCTLSEKTREETPSLQIGDMCDKDKMKGL